MWKKKMRAKQTRYRQDVNEIKSFAPARNRPLNLAVDLAPGTASSVPPSPAISARALSWNKTVYVSIQNHTTPTASQTWKLKRFK